jgi:hypothetical protein
LRHSLFFTCSNQNPLESFFFDARDEVAKAQEEVHELEQTLLKLQEQYKQEVRKSGFSVVLFRFINERFGLSLESLVSGAGKVIK